MATAYSSDKALATGAHERAQAIARAAKRRRRRDLAAAYSFIAPSVLLFALFMLYPVAKLIQESFESGGVLGPATWVGLKNWSELGKDPAVSATLDNTLKFTGLYVPIVIVLSLAVALLLREVRVGGAVVRAAVYLPTIAPLVLVGIVWVFLLHPEFGLINYISRGVGAGTPDWLGSSSLAMPTIVAVEVWRAVGFWAMLILAALMAVPDDLYQAAKIDGASTWSRFRHVTLPALRPSLIAVLGLSIIGALQVFDSVYILTGGGPAGSTETVGIYVYNSIFQNGNTGYGAALSLIMAVVVAVGTGVVFGISRSARGKFGGGKGQ